MILRMTLPEHLIVPTEFSISDDFVSQDMFTEPFETFYKLYFDLDVNNIRYYGDEINPKLEECVYLLYTVCHWCVLVSAGIDQQSKLRVAELYSLFYIVYRRYVCLFPTDQFDIYLLNNPDRYSFQENIFKGDFGVLSKMEKLIECLSGIYSSVTGNDIECILEV
jgi:hypothetical protein